MNISGLVDAIAVFVESKLENMPTGTNKNTTKIPKVIKYDLPLKESDDEPDFPYVLIMPDEGSDDEEQSTVSVLLQIGAYAEDNEGFADVLNVLQTIRTALLQTAILDKRYRLNKPLKWSRNRDTQNYYPQWIAVMQTEWTLPLPNEINYITEVTDG